MPISNATKLLAGITLITVPSIQYGGIFLLGLLRNPNSGYTRNPVRQNLFRAGHAHAGVLVILSLICQVLVDAAALPSALAWFVRLGIPSSAILIPLGFFVSVASPAAVKPNGAISLVYVGALLLAISVVTLGVGLIRAA